MAMQNTSTSWTNGSYEDDRNYFIKVAENDPLRQGVAGKLGLTIDSAGRPVIGYGYDLKAHSASSLTGYLASGITISAEQTEILNAYNENRKVNFTGSSLNGTIPTGDQLKSAWNTITLASEAKATDLLNLVVADYETALDKALGDTASNRVQLPKSRERAAIISLLYSLSGPSSVAIQKAIPTTLNLIKNGTNDPTQRGEIWYEIRYNSNSDNQHTKRRVDESNLFGLYKNGSSPADDTKALAIIRVYTEHKGKIVSYESAHPSEMSGGQGYANQLSPAKNKLIADYGLGNSFGEILVGADAAYLGGDQDTISGDSTQAVNELIIAQSGDDSINAYAGDDVIYGGKGNDYLNGGVGNDTYFYATGDGNDVIKDDQGASTIKLNGTTFTGTFKQLGKDSNIYSQFDAQGVAYGPRIIKDRNPLTGDFNLWIDLNNGAKGDVLRIANWSDANNFGLTLVDAAAPTLPALTDPVFRRAQSDHTAHGCTKSALRRDHVLSRSARRADAADQSLHRPVFSQRQRR